MKKIVGEGNKKYTVEENSWWRKHWACYVHKRSGGLLRKSAYPLTGTLFLPGPFLDILLRKLEDMLSNGLYVNLHLTGLISRLALHPQPLLRSFLLNHSLVFQPSIRSLFQVSN